MSCQREIAREIIEAQADYLLAVKENQGRLYDDVRDLFEGAEEYDFEGVPYDFARTLNKGHGRLETRQCWTKEDRRERLHQVMDAFVLGAVPP